VVLGEPFVGGRLARETSLSAGYGTRVENAWILASLMTFCKRASGTLAGVKCPEFE
jgi:hypothetical protein